MSDPKTYWQKPEKSLSADFAWNFPEQKSGILSIVGGNVQHFANVIKTAESAKNNFPFKTVQTVLPTSLKAKIPAVLPDLIYAASTPAGSFDRSALLDQTVESSDFAIFVGDFSKNSTTTIAIASALKNDTPAVLIRDTIDLLCPEMAELITRKDLYLVASLAQLQKVFRAVYYPKVLLLSMPLLPVVETMHKFTLSYPVTILTLHQEQIIVANGGRVITTPLTATNYNPLSLWNGTTSASIAAFNLWNPGKPLESTIAAVF